MFSHLEKVLIHMIDEEDAQIFKSCDDYARTKKPYSVSKVCRNMAIHVSYLLICSFSM